METGYTNHLKRLVALCTGQWSYRLASFTLAELCGIRLCHTMMGELAAEVADEIADSLPNNSEIRNDFQKANGAVEFYADGVFVHIRNDNGKAEWCEAKVGAFAKRVPGERATPEEWGSRKLPEPTVVSAFAAIENKEDFQERCQRERRRLGVGGVSSALGDGAKWIWNIVWEVFGKTSECLDIYHGAEHISDCGKVLYGAGQTSSEWLERMRLVLLSEGFAGMERELSPLLASVSKGAERESLSSLLDYFRGNKDRLNYCERLADGRAIGSGLIEGACKNLVGKRLKQTGACWRKDRANKIAILAAVLYSGQWQHCRKNSP